MDEVNREKSQTVEELIEQLARERANNQRLKASLDKISSQIAQYKHRFSEFEKIEEQRKEVEFIQKKELDDLRKQLKIVNYAKKFVEMGMDEKEAERTAGAMLGGNIELFDKSIANLIKKIEKTAENEAIQKLLVDRTEVHAGNGRIDDSSSLTMASQYVSQQLLDVDALERFK